jgi:hypothetical protein
MGLSIRIFIVEDDDTIKRLPLASYERLHKRDLYEQLSKYAGKRVRYALIVLDLVNRKPIEIVRDQFGFLDFHDKERLKISEHEQKDSLAFDILAPLLSDQTNSRVIGARHKFAKKSYLDKFSWTPMDEIIAVFFTYLS